MLLNLRLVVKADFALTTMRFDVEMADSRSKCVREEMRRRQSRRAPSAPTG